MLDSIVLPNTRRDDIIKKLLSYSYINEFGCWIWLGGTSGNGRGGGYGRVSLNGSTCAVHLVSYTHFYGFIPPRKQVDHTCNNRLCFNPLHLELVTHKQNQLRRDKRRKQCLI